MIIENVMVKTHLIVTDIHEEYNIKWYGKIIDTQPVLKDGLPVFVIISSESRMELNTISMKQIEDRAKQLTRPRGRAAITEDKAYIYIKEANNKETLIGVVTHQHVKKYAPMYDAIGYTI